MDNIQQIQKLMKTAYCPVTKKRSKRYMPTSDLLFSFDIETSSWTEQYSTMYCWSLGAAEYKDLVKCKNNDDLLKITKILFERTWYDFDIICEILNGTAEELNRLFIVLIYNLSYEWSFMQKNIEFIKRHYYPDYPTVIEGNHNILAVRAGNLIFLDAARLFGLGSLKQNAEKYGFKKLEYDYDVLRHSKTKLTKKEKLYNVNDVIITLGAWSRCLANNGYEHIEGAPYTNTAMIKSILKQNPIVNEQLNDRIHSKRNKNGKRYKQHEKYTRFDEALDIATHVFPEEYDIEKLAVWLENAFNGGYTHCNVFTQGKLLFNVGSADLGSAYPSAMMTSWFPRKLLPVKYPNKKFYQIMQVLNKKYVGYINIAKATRETLEAFAIVTITLSNVSVKIHNGFTMPLISKHKLLDFDKNALFDNGKLVECDNCKISCTTIDIMTWQLCYNFTVTECHEMLIGSEIQELPQYWRNSVEYCYQAKTVLKQTVSLYKSGNNWEDEYLKLPDIDNVEINHVKSMEFHEAIHYLSMVLLQRKGELNGLYGIMVMHIIRRMYQYNENKDIVEGEKNIREAKDATCYLWGIIITAIVRLWEVTFSLYVSDNGCLPAYWDTDSVKFCYGDIDVKNLIKKFNEQVGYIVDKYSALGAYDYEGTYYAFKSLGSKRYIACEQNKDGNYEWESTIAGLPKRVFSNFLTQVLNENIRYMPLDKAIEMSAYYFKPNMYVDESATNKLIPKYIKDPVEVTLKCIDYQGVECIETFYPGARLSGVQFAIMSLDSNENRTYQRLCDRMQNRIFEDSTSYIISFDNELKKYVIEEGKLEKSKLKVYMYQQDVEVYQ